jgi:hypothetical protein
LNRRCLGVGQESLPLDHGTICIERKPWDSNPQRSYRTCFRDRLLIRPDDFRFQVAGAGIEPTPERSERPVLPLDDPASITKVRGAGLEPASPGSKPGSLPLADPRISQSALRESNPPRQLGRLAPLPLGQGHKAAAAGIEPASGRLTVAYPYQHGSHRNKSGRLDLNQRSRAPEARGIPDFPTS